MFGFMSSKKLTIQKTGDPNYLPVAHTCFILLDLPEYATKEKEYHFEIKEIEVNVADHEQGGRLQPRQLHTQPSGSWQCNNLQHR